MLLQIKLLTRVQATVSSCPACCQAPLLQQPQDGMAASRDGMPVSCHEIPSESVSAHRAAGIHC